MFDNILTAYGIWGLLGAFMYAAQRLILCFRAATCRFVICGMDFAAALIVGAIAAAAFTPVVSAILHRKADSDIVAVATIIGLLANRIAPELVKVVGDGAVQLISRHILPREKLDD